MADVEVVEVGPQIVLGLRRTGHYQQISTMIMELAEFAVSNGIQIAGPPVFISHEMSAEEAMKADAEGTADVEVVFPIAGEAEGRGEIRIYDLPGGTMAKIVHRGAYQDLGSAYEKLFSWLEQHRKTIAGPLREVYLNAPQEVPEEEILTEIYAPIR